MAIIYGLGTLRWVHESSQPPTHFWIASFLGAFVPFFVLNAPWHELAPASPEPESPAAPSADSESSEVPERGIKGEPLQATEDVTHGRLWSFIVERFLGTPERPKGWRYWLLVTQTLVTITLLGWFCAYSGGTETSPYALVLLSVAILSPYVTSGWPTVALIVLAVAVSYLGFSHTVGSWLPGGDPPGARNVAVEPGLVLATSGFNVLLSLMIEFVRQWRESNVPWLSRFLARSFRRAIQSGPRT